jgi:hypothetical protein
MTSYRVYKILQVDTRQLLLVCEDGSAEFSLSVYDEHTGQTLLRLCACTLEDFERAIGVLRG